MTITTLNEDGDDFTFDLPCKKEVCPRCGGTGSHDPEAFSNGFTQSEFNEVFEDAESREDYFRGVYDVSCEECNGNNVIDAPNREEFDLKDLANYTLWQDQLNFDYQCKMEEAAERRMGC
jgi:DnaJ-class molecular chaperone